MRISLGPSRTMSAPAPFGQPRVLLPKHFHLINFALSQVNKLLLLLGLAFKDGGQVRGDVRRRSEAHLRVLHDSSSTTGGDHSRHCLDCLVKYHFVPHGGRQLFLWKQI